MTSEHSLDKQSRPELLAPLRSVLSTSPAAEIHLHCQSQPFLLETIEHGLCHEHAERPLKYSRGIVQLEQALPIALQSPSHVLRNLWVLCRVWVDGAVAPHLVDGVALSLKGWVCWIKKKLGRRAEVSVGGGGSGTVLASVILAAVLWRRRRGQQHRVDELVFEADWRSHGRMRIEALCGWRQRADNLVIAVLAGYLQQWIRSTVVAFVLARQKLLNETTHLLLPFLEKLVTTLDHEDASPLARGLESAVDGLAGLSPIQVGLDMKGANETILLAVDRNEWNIDIAQERPGVDVVEHSETQTYPTAQRDGIVNGRVQIERKRG